MHTSLHGNTAQPRRLDSVPRRGGVVAAAAALLLIGLLSGSARADEEESDEASVLAEQAISLIANDAGDARVAERIEDALMAPEKEGVDLVPVRQALDVVERPGRTEAADEQARTLLLDALGGKLPSAPEAGAFATGTETGTSEILGEFRPARGVSDDGDAVLLGLAGAAVVGGLWLSHRWRPPHTIRQLEHRDAGEES
ncbi:hypothetical protein [Streptomyces anulatus]|uniref:hypothetical protein n=1 Tax=Streptomyces anulatus TaxID=1892 RepID=UPI0004CC30D7|nr:hypothetical protein [Streptomyces anulatus]